MKENSFLWASIFIIIACTIGFIVSEIVSDEAGHDRQFEAIEVEVTAYSPSRAQTSGKNPFEMASGLIATPNDLWQLKYIGVSRDLKTDYNLKWGDSIFIEFSIQDLMGKTAQGKITEKTVDIFFRNQDLARKFGRQNRTIIIKRR